MANRFPITRILYGPRTGLQEDEKSQKNIFDNIINYKMPPIHMSLDFVDYYTSIGYSRTYMLSNLANDYFKNVKYTHSSLIETHDETTREKDAMYTHN